MPADLVEFLRARCGEDQARAEQMSHQDPDGLASYLACPATRSERLGDLPFGEENCDCGMPARRTRALAEVAAKRALLELHLVTEDRVYYAPDDRQQFQNPIEVAICYTCSFGESCDDCFSLNDSIEIVRAPCRVLRLLALPFASHPDYDPAWNTATQETP